MVDLESSFSLLFAKLVRNHANCQDKIVSVGSSIKSVVLKYNQLLSKGRLKALTENRVSTT